MFSRLNFSLQQQFHLLIHMFDGEHAMAILPGCNGRFLVIDQGNILGELSFDKQFVCISGQADWNIHLMEQLRAGIKNYYRKS
ncbi:MAG TPA: hypothetical protein VHB54_04815 [Mucilaginibacter sp.]|nr:hypothetical protein [Mucilaginibacter sp.]